VRAPRLRDALELGRSGVLREAVGAPHRGARAQVADRQDVRAAEVEDQEHVRRPRPEPLDGHELGLHLVVVELGQPVEVQAAVLDARREVAQVLDLAPRQADAAHLLVVGGEQLRRRRRPAAEQLLEPPVDRPRGLGGELLADDRPKQGAIGVGRPAAAPGLRVERPDAVDQLAQDRIGAAQVAHGCLRRDLRLGAGARARRGPRACLGGRSSTRVSGPRHLRRRG
jgi:hypothetical protein